MKREVGWQFPGHLTTDWWPVFYFFKQRLVVRDLFSFHYNYSEVTFFSLSTCMCVCSKQDFPWARFFQSICLHCDCISRCPMSFPNTDIPVQCWLHQYSAFSLVSPVQPAHEPSVAITEEEERKCQPVQTQNTEKVNIVEHAAMIHRDFKSLIFHLLTKIVMRTENGTTLIHLCDKHHNEGGSVQASNIHFTDLWSLFCNGTQTPTARLDT